MAIAYLPIEIDVKLPDEQKVLDYIHENYIKQEKFAKHWKFVPVLTRLEDHEWDDLVSIKHLSNTRYNKSDKKPKYYKDVADVFPEIIHMLNQLPFKEITMAAMLLQTKYVGHHMDPHPGDVYEDMEEVSLENEPHRYNILLTEHNKDAFFCSEIFNGPKIYPKITREMPCYAFCERYHWHGSDYISDRKVQLSVFGIVDKVKHKNFIIKNLTKYHNQAIIFPDPVDPNDPMIFSQFDKDGNDLYY